MQGYDGPKEYIASQGTKDNTEIDFWRMITQHKIVSVVMLTNVREEHTV